MKCSPEGAPPRTDESRWQEAGNCEREEDGGVAEERRASANRPENARERERSCQLAVQLAETRTGPAQLRRGLGRSGSLSTNGACQLDLVCYEFPRQPASACRFESPRMALRFESIVRRSRIVPSIEQVASREATRRSSRASMSTTEANEKQRLHY